MRLRRASVAATFALALVTHARAQDSAVPAAGTPDAGEDAQHQPVSTAALLADARAALRAGELERALALAQRGLRQSPDDVDALTVLGMLEAERGDPEAALPYFEAALARAGERAPAGLSWNRAACLSALGRAEEAEYAFREVAAHGKPPLDALALINAGLAALDADAPERARRYLTQAQRRGREHELEAELQELQDELDVHDDGERERLRTAVARGELDAAEPAIERELRAHPDDAELQYLGGLVAYRRTRATLAEKRLRRARQLGLDPERDALARDYLELLAGGLWLTGRGVYADLELGGGYDSNAVQAGLGQGNPLLSGSNGSLGGPYLRVRAELGYGTEPWARGFAVARYAMEQLAYTKASLDLWNAQQHELALELEQRWGDGWRLAALTRASFELSGISDLRPFAAGAGGELGVGLDHGGGARTRLSGAVQSSEVLDSDYAFLSGTRLELTLQEGYAHGALRAGLFASYRAELLGTQHVATQVPLRLCGDCTAQYVIPLGYHGPRAGLSGSYRVMPALRAAARLTGELRTYRSDAFLELSSPTAGRYEVAARVERDVRLSLGAGLTLDLPDPLEVDVDYDVTFAWSNTDNTQGGAHTLDYANRQFVRHLLWLGLAVRL